MSTRQALVLARGLATRMRAADPGAELSPDQQRAADAGSKTMMPIAGRPFLDYVLNSIAEAGIPRVGLVVAPSHDALAHHYTAVTAPSRLTIDFIVQQEARGTADAVLAARAWTDDDDFLVMNGDNLYPSEVLRDLAAIDSPGLPGFRRRDLVASGNIPDGRVASYALIDIDDRDNLTRIIEKPAADEFARAGAGALVSMNCWHFDRRIFQACRDVPLSARGELELPGAVMLAVERGVRFRVIPSAGPVLDLSYRADAAALSSRLAGVVVRL